MNQIKSVLLPIETANGLPNACYTDPTMHRHEAGLVFHDGWTAIGFGCDVPRAGSIYPVTVSDMPLLIVRNRAGLVKVFENVCRHRGMILAEEPAQLSGPISCPYHAWAYDLDGHLRATPHVGGPGIHEHEDVDISQLSLTEIRSVVWRDVVYVNLSGTAPSFDDFIAPLHGRWAEFDQPIHSGGSDSMFELQVRCNWKLAVENYCEAYHLPFVHPGLNSYSRLEDHYNILDDEGYAGQGTLVYNPQLDSSGRQFPRFSNLSRKWDTAGEYCALFPNVLYGVHNDHCYAIILLPVGQAETIERVSIYYADKQALGKEFADMRATNARMWKDIFIEDIGVVEGMQKGRMAPHYDGGKFSPRMDNPTHHFHKWVASRLSRTAATV